MSGRRVQGSRESAGRRARGVRRVARARAFTLIELLVVIVIIGVLAALVLTVSGHVSSSQKVSATKNTMRLVRMAIDQFAETDPLQGTYDNAKLRDNKSNVIGRTFGPYPPYQLATARKGYPPTTVRDALEPYYALSGQNVPPDSLSPRLARDLSGAREGASPPIIDEDWVSIGYVNDQWNDDMRALYGYLAAYAPGVMSQIPDGVKKVLPGCKDPQNYPEMINPTGKGTKVGSTGAINVLGIYDAWGVPLDYFLQVKLEWMVPPDGGNARWVVTDRVPVLRSRAITQDEIDAEAAGTDKLDPERWIFSDPFPQPAAKLGDASAGTLINPPGGQPNVNNGWVRVRAGGKAADQTTWDNYRYLPEE